MPSEPSTTGPLRARRNLLLLGTMLIAFIGVHLVMERLAVWAETQERAYLWRQEEWLQALSPSNYPGAGQLLMYGPSESREAFLPERFDPRLAGWRAFQNSQSMGTIEDLDLLLDYIERVHGRTALPDALLVGITTRFVANIRSFPSPLRASIDSYSPQVRVEQRGRELTLVDKDFCEGLRASLDFRFRQQRRYAGALRALTRAVLRRTLPSLAEDRLLNLSLTPSKYGHLAPRPLYETQAWLAEPGNFWEAVHAWDPARDRDAIVRRLRGLVDFARARDIQIFVVNMPELSWNRSRYHPGRYEAYMEAVRVGLGATPFLDLRVFLPDDLYFDSCHPTLEGCARVSDRIAGFIAQHRSSRGDE